MANIDKVSVKNTVYNIVSPAVVSDYIEVIGGACTKPDGYEEDEVILAKQNDVQLLFKATQDIDFGANIVENTNCVRTTLEEVLKNAGGGGGASSADQVSYDNSASGLEAENVQEAVDELASENQTLTNAFTKQSTVNGAVNELDHTGVTDTSGTVKFTVNEDKSITVSANSYPVTLDSTTTFFFYGSNSTAVPNIFKGKKFTGCPSGDTSGKVKIAIQGFSSTTPSSGTDYSDTGNGVIIGNENYIRMYIRLGSGYQLTSALTFKPMISLPELGLSYADYQPYAKTNRQLTEDSVDWDSFSILGAVNFLDSEIVTQDNKGIHIEANSDGSYTVSSNSAPTGNLSLLSTKTVTLPVGTYRWTASQNGKDAIGDSSFYCFIKGINNTTAWYRSYDSSYGYGEFTLTEESTITFGIATYDRATAVPSTTFYPMIAPVDYNGDYVPYSKTNRELTEDVASIEADVSNLLSGNLTNAKILSIGNKRYVKIGRSSGATNYMGLIAIATQSSGDAKSFIGGVANNVTQNAITPLSALAISTDSSNRIVLDSGFEYAHWFIAITSELTDIVVTSNN